MGSTQAPQNLEEQWQWAARMLNLGHHAHSIAVSMKYKPPKMDREMYSQLWNTIGSLILEEQYDAEAGIDTDRDMEAKDAQVIDAMLPNDQIDWSRSISLARSDDSTSGRSS